MFLFSEVGGHAQGFCFLIFVFVHICENIAECSQLCPEKDCVLTCFFHTVVKDAGLIRNLAGSPDFLWSGFAVITGQNL